MRRVSRFVKAFPVIMAFAILAGSSACGKKDEKLVKVSLNEVVHSIFYAPQYAAIALGYFADEGLEINLSVGQGADKSMVAVLSGDADIGLMGTEAAIYVINEGREDYAAAFAQLTQTAGNFLVARDASLAEGSFDWNSLKGKTVIGGRAGGMPQMMLEYVLKQKGITPGVDVEIVQNLQFTSTAGAFAGGVGDFTAEFDPAARGLETAGHGKVAASIGAEAGGVPYTVYMAKKSYIDKNPGILQKFTNAVYKGQQYVAGHSAEESAKVIQPFFEESGAADLAVMINRYKACGAWKDNPSFDKAGYERLVSIMQVAGELEAAPAFEKIVTNKFCDALKKK